MKFQVGDKVKVLEGRGSEFLYDTGVISFIKEDNCSPYFVILRVKNTSEDYAVLQSYGEEDLELVKPAMPFKIGNKVRFIYPNRNSEFGIGIVQRIDGLSCRVIFNTEDKSKRYALCYAYELELVEDEDETELLTENHIETFSDYQHAARRTMNNDRSYTETLANLSMGLAGETGELVDHLKKYLFHGHELDAEKVKKELGDVLWYLTVLADELDYDMEDIAIANIDKLTKRYPEGFSAEASKNRKEG